MPWLASPADRQPTLPSSPAFGSCAFSSLISACVMATRVSKCAAQLNIYTTLSDAGTMRNDSSWRACSLHAAARLSCMVNQVTPQMRALYLQHRAALVTASDQARIRLLTRRSWPHRVGLTGITKPASPG